MNTPLIAYYSLFGNTRNLAFEIARQTGGTLYEITPEKSYSFDYHTAAKEVRGQIASGFCPKLILQGKPMDTYLTIFIGTPNWFKSFAPPVRSFLALHDFLGKTVIPFCTHGGGGMCQIEQELAKACPNSVILPGIAVDGAVDPFEVEAWLEAIGMQLR
jgi:flavodoxin